jgi:ATP-dependent exoDNAse (exonuclease V) beta subunit
MAVSIAQSDAAWLWDETHIDWQANEYELRHGKQWLRIDRLVRHTSTQQWWIIDFKSSQNPQNDSQLIAQLERYSAALMEHLAIDRLAVVCAFATPLGLIVLPAIAEI